MKAVAVFPADKQIRLIDQPAPRPSAPTDVVVKMLEVGICGTDREIASFDYGTPPAGSDYLVIGHESLGQVVQTGPAVTRVREGDLVVTMVRRPCPHLECRACRHQRPDFCFTGDFTERGIKGRHGFMTELVVDDESYLTRVPAALREVGVLVEPLTIAEKALAQVWDVQDRLPWIASGASGAARGAGHTALVLGGGPVGLLGAMALVTSGFDTYVYSLEAEPNPKAEFTRALGATWVCAKEVTPDALEQRMGRIDLVYEATGASKLAFDMVAHLGANGVFVFTGVPGRKGPVDIDTDRLMRGLVLKNQLIVGSVNAGRVSYEAAIADLGLFLKRWPAQVRSLITSRTPLERFAEQLGGRPTGIKNVLTIG